MLLVVKRPRSNQKGNIGGFAEILRARGDLQIKIPDNLTDEEAATLVRDLFLF